MDTLKIGEIVFSDIITLAEIDTICLATDGCYGYEFSNSDMTYYQLYKASVSDEPKGDGIGGAACYFKNRYTEL